MSKNTYKILIVDDEEDLCEILQFNLEGEGFITDIAYSAESAMKKDLKSFDLILLDVMMEKMSGFKFAEKLRKEFKILVPIIFVTAKNTENDMITGFNLGGDDYISKPFSVKEVIVRIKAVLRRAAAKDKPAEKVLSYEDLEILVLLLRNRGLILTRNDILNRVWDDTTIVAQRTVDVHIARLRKKIKKYGDHIKSKSGFGYTFDS